MRGVQGICSNNVDGWMTGTMPSVGEARLAGVDLTSIVVNHGLEPPGRNPFNENLTSIVVNHGSMLLGQGFHHPVLI